MPGTGWRQWLGHLMASRSETARQLLTPGEIMQLPPDDEIVMVAGSPPIRAKKARYFEDRRFVDRVVAPPEPEQGTPMMQDDPWSSLPAIEADTPTGASVPSTNADEATRWSCAGRRTWLSNCGRSPGKDRQNRAREFREMIL